MGDPPRNVEANSLKAYQGHSRLHFIGSWVTTAEEWLRDELFAAHPEYEHGPVEQRWVVHLDMDCFFCSIQLAKPEHAHLADSPCAIFSGGDRSEISACNYPARRFGVHAGMWGAKAKELCPGLIPLPYDFDAVARINKALYRMLFDSCPVGASMALQVLSVDEVLIAFDMQRLSDVADYCSAVRQDIEAEFRLTASCGVAPTIAAARMATSLAKPNGQRCVARHEVAEFVQGMPAKELHGVGPAMLRKLQAAYDQCHPRSAESDAPELKCGDIAAIRAPLLKEAAGRKYSETLTRLVKGEDGRIVRRSGCDPGQPPKAVGCVMHYAVRPRAWADVTAIFSDVAADVTRKLDRHGLAATSLKATVLQRKPGAPLLPPKHMGCGRCVERAVSAKMQVPEHRAAKCVDVAFGKLRPLLAPVGPAGSLEVTAGAEAPEPDPEGPIQLHDIRGIGLSLSGLVPRASDTAVEKQISLTAAFRTVTTKNAAKIEAAPAAQTVGDSSPEVLSASATKRARSAFDEIALETQLSAETKPLARPRRRLETDSDVVCLGTPTPVVVVDATQRLPPRDGAETTAATVAKAVAILHPETTTTAPGVEGWGRRLQRVLTVVCDPLLLRGERDRAVAVWRYAVHDVPLAALKAELCCRVLRTAAGRSL